MSLIINNTEDTRKWYADHEEREAKRKEYERKLRGVYSTLREGGPVTCNWTDEDILIDPFNAEEYVAKL